MTSSEERKIREFNIVIYSRCDLCQVETHSAILEPSYFQAFASAPELGLPPAHRHLTEMRASRGAARRPTLPLALSDPTELLALAPVAPTQVDALSTASESAGPPPLLAGANETLLPQDRAVHPAGRAF